jgi:hypothetical protein
MVRVKSLRAGGRHRGVVGWRPALRGVRGALGAGLARWVFGGWLDRWVQVMDQ